MNEIWRLKSFKRLDPKVFIKYLKAQVTYSNLSSKSRFYTDPMITGSVVYYEEINEGLWLFSIETEESRNTCYRYQPKLSQENYYSINYYTSTGKFGYEINGALNWNNNVVIFANPETTYQIYLRKEMTLKSYRLVFTKEYLHRLLNFSAYPLVQFDLHKAITAKLFTYYRNIADTEQLILRRIHYIQKHGQQNFDHHLSLVKSIYELTECFFRLSMPGKQLTGELQNKPPLMDRAVAILEKHIQDSFPGINALAERCHVSPTKLKSQFKKTYQLSPLLYFRKLQMVYAADMLEKKELSIKELSQILGFKKASTFSFWFKKLTGKKPTEM